MKEQYKDDCISYIQYGNLLFRINTKVQVAILSQARVKKPCLTYHEGAEAFGIQFFTQYFNFRLGWSNPSYHTAKVQGAFRICLKCSWYKIGFNKWLFPRS